MIAATVFYTPFCLSAGLLNWCSLLVSTEALVVLGLLLWFGEVMFLEFSPYVYLIIGPILEEVFDMTLARADIVDIGRLALILGYVGDIKFLS